MKPKPGEVWGLNLNREQVDQEGAAEYPCWSPTMGPFHQINRWGHIVFADGDTNVQAVAQQIADRHKEKSFEVTVTDKETGKPLPGATVLTMALVPNLNPRPLTDQTATDKDGRCRVERISRDMHVAVKSVGYAEKSVGRPTTPGPTTKHCFAASLHPVGASGGHDDRQACPQHGTPGICSG